MMNGSKTAKVFLGVALLGTLFFLPFGVNMTFDGIDKGWG